MLGFEVRVYASQQRFPNVLKFGAVPHVVTDFRVLPAALLADSLFVVSARGGVGFVLVFLCFS